MVSSSQAAIVMDGFETMSVRPPARYSASNSLQPAKPLTRLDPNSASAKSDSSTIVSVPSSP